MEVMAEIVWLDCPYGRINDPFPGQCELYTDTNSNEVCDHSEPPEGVKGVEGVEGILVFLTLGIYFVHWYLVHKTTIGKSFKWLSRASFHYFWNLILLLSFLPVAVSGLLLVFGVTNFDFNLWHNRAGLVFTLVAALHLLKRFQHFLNVPRR